MKFGQLIEYKTRDIFLFKIHVENKKGRLVLDLFFYL